MVTVVWQIWSMGCFFDCLPYEWQSGTSDGLFLPIYPPRDMRSSTLLQGLINFCNKYMSSLWLMWVHGFYALLPFHHCVPLRYCALPFITSRVGANFAGASKPCDTIRSITHKPHYIFLKTATIPTYHAIPRYIAMQLPSSSYTWLEHLLSYCFAWS